VAKFQNLPPVFVGHVNRRKGREDPTDQFHAVNVGGKKRRGGGGGYQNKKRLDCIARPWVISSKGRKQRTHQTSRSKRPDCQCDVRNVCA